MNILTVTSYNKSLEKAYAYRFKQTYNWPFKLKVYNEDIDMFDKIPNCHAFVERNKNKHKYSKTITKHHIFASANPIAPLRLRLGRIDFHASGRLYMVMTHAPPNPRLCCNATFAPST